MRENAVRIQLYRHVIITEGLFDLKLQNKFNNEEAGVFWKAVRLGYYDIGNIKFSHPHSRIRTLKSLDLRVGPSLFHICLSYLKI